MFSAIVAAGWLLAQAAVEPARAADPAPAAAPAAAKAEKPKKPKLICTEETQIDSVIPKRVCRTPEQVEADRAAARRNTDNMMDHLATCKGASC